MFLGSRRRMRRASTLIAAVASLLFLASCSFHPAGLYYGKDTTLLVRDKMAHIVDALNTRDGAALRAMFTHYARTEYPTDIDKGVTRLLSLFAEGDVIWHDPGGWVSESDNYEFGKVSTLSGAADVVSSGGKDYLLSFSLFTKNTIDPDNVGIYQMGAVLHTDSEDSGTELAFDNWSSTIDDNLEVRKGGPPGVFFGDSGGLSRDRVTRIVDALNGHDAAALRAMFTVHARAGYSAEIDDGLAYLFSLFPNGDVAIKPGSGGSAVYEQSKGDKRTVLLPTFYTVTSGGVDYRLFFADFTENTIDPDNVGIYAIGAAPAAETWRDVPQAELHDWSTPFYIGSSASPGIYIPKNWSIHPASVEP